MPPRDLDRDSVDSCVTNHRIVREHGADRSAPPGALPTRGRGRQLDGPAPRPASRGESGKDVRANRREAARPVESRSIALGSRWEGNRREFALLIENPRGGRRTCRHPGLRDGADVAFSGPGWTAWLAVPRL